MSFFITGTGTGVGKTIVTAALAAWFAARGESVCVYKPLQTGSSDATRPEDPEMVMRLTQTTPQTTTDGVAGCVETFCSYCLPEPLAPLAADKEGIIRPEQCLADLKQLQSRYTRVLVEGAGGIRVPVTRNTDMLDLIRQFGLPVVVVTHPGLGGINHTLLTVDALLGQGLDVAGVIVSAGSINTPDVASQSFLPTIQPFLRVPVLGALPSFCLEDGLFTQPETLSLVDPLGTALLHYTDCSRTL